jgi:hypothetical protein
MTEIKTPTTFELIQAANVLIMALTEDGGELDERSEALLDSFLSGCGDKLGGIRAMIKRCDTNAAYLTAEAKRLTDRKASLGKIKDRCRGYAKDLLQAHEELTGTTKVTTPTYTAYLTKRQAVVGPELAEDWPEAWRTEEVTTRLRLDKAGALAAMKGGAEIDGLTLNTSITAAFR